MTRRNAKKRRGILIYTAFLFFVVGALLLTPSDAPIVTPDPLVAWTDNPVLPAPAEVPRGSTITPEEIESFRLAAPVMNQVWLEFETHPYSESHSLLQFDAHLDFLTEKARENRVSARVFMEELRACSLDGRLHSLARANCLSHAEELALAFPELGPQFAAIERYTPSSVRDQLPSAPAVGGTGP